MFKVKLSVLFVLPSMFLGNWAFSAEKGAYTLADLRALEKQKGYLELVVHLTDVPPSARNQEWKIIAERGSIRLMESLPDKSCAVQCSIDALVHLIPLLKESKPFMEKRAAFGLKSFETCYEDARSSRGFVPWCTDHANEFIQADKDNTGLALQIGQLVGRNDSPLKALPFYQLAVAGKNSAEVCTNPKVRAALSFGLQDVPGASREIARTLAEGVCWDHVGTYLMGKIDEYNGKGFAPGICELAEKKGVLTPERKAKCDSNG